MPTNADPVPGLIENPSPLVFSLICSKRVVEYIDIILTPENWLNIAIAQTSHVALLYFGSQRTSL